MGLTLGIAALVIAYTLCAIWLIRMLLEPDSALHLSAIASTPIHR